MRVCAKNTFIWSVQYYIGDIYFEVSENDELHLFYYHMYTAVLAGEMCAIHSIIHSKESSFFPEYIYLTCLTAGDPRPRYETTLILILTANFFGLVYNWTWYLCTT